MKNIDETLKEASKCLNCKNPSCKKGCPIATNIPEFILEIKNQNFNKAYEILQENNLMSDICSTICPAEEQCTGNCIKGIKDKPIPINELEKFINEWAKENNIKYDTIINHNTNKKVAVIGAGPAGIACSIALRKAGADVTIFEKEDKCGGILEYGIPDFRLSKEMVTNIVKRISNLGIKIENNKELGKDITINSLKNDGFDNIFLGIGAQRQTTYKLIEEPAKTILTSEELLKNYNEKGKIENLGITVVIGGGNVALDSARAAIRMGAKEVYVLYRRNKELMPAREIELKEAIEDGVKVIFQTKVISAKSNNNKIEEIECIKTKIENDKAINIENSNYKMEANTIIFAIGAKANEELLNSLGIKTSNGLVEIDENYMTNIDGVYAGGDLVESKSYVARAIATGKKAAHSILNRKERDK